MMPGRRFFARIKINEILDCWLELCYTSFKDKKGDAMTDLEYIQERLRLADEGQQPVGNIIIAIGSLVEIIKQQQRRIETLEQQRQQGGRT